MGVFLNYKGNHHIPENMNHINIVVDMNRFSQVIRNIISNALKFTPGGGSISISISESNSRNSPTPNQSIFERAHSTYDKSELRFDQRSNSDLSSPKFDYIRIDIADTGLGMSQVLNYLYIYIFYYLLLTFDLFFISSFFVI